MNEFVTVEPNAWAFCHNFKFKINRSIPDSNVYPIKSNELCPFSGKRPLLEVSVRGDSTVLHAVLLRIIFMDWRVGLVDFPGQNNFVSPFLVVVRHPCTTRICTLSVARRPSRIHWLTTIDIFSLHRFCCLLATVSFYVSCAVVVGLICRVVFFVTFFLPYKTTRVLSTFVRICTECIRFSRRY